MRRMVMYKRPIKPECGRKLTLIYSVTVDELDELGIECFGASIAVKESGEEARVSNVTLDFSEIFTLIKLLADCLVTPVTLYDVVYDWICRA